MTQYNGVYFPQGADEMVVASTTGAYNQGKVTVQSGSLGVQFPVQTLGTSETGTNIIGMGLTTVTASTTAPTYTIGAPAAAGLIKGIAISAATSAASSAIIAGETTGVQIGVTGDNQITLTSTGASVGCILWSASTSAWAVCTGEAQITAAQST